MLQNVSYNNKKIEEAINDAVGKPYSLFQSISLGGIGSPKLRITGASQDIHELLNLDNNMDACNIELRPGGIIVRFRSILETYALTIPYYKLSLYKGDIESYSIYCDTHLIKVQDGSESIRRFINRIVGLKAEFLAGTQPIR